MFKGADRKGALVWKFVPPNQVVCVHVCVCVCVCAFKREFEVEYIEGGIREALTLRDTQRYGQTV